jgi:hypothetical protein
LRRFPQLLALTLLCFPAFSGAQTPALQGGAMLECSGLPCVDIVTNGGKHLRMLIDTGNASSIVDAAIAKDLGLTTTPVTGQDGKPVDGYSRAALNNVMLGDASLGDVKVLVLSLAKYIERDRVPKCDGMLSYTVFKNRLLELDYKKKTVRISAALTTDLKCPGFCGDITYPTFGNQGPPIVVATGFTVNAKPLTVQIDTLFSGTMLVYSPSVDKLGLGSQSASSEKEFFRYTDDGVDMIKSQADDESFGSHVLAKGAPVFFPTPAVHQPDGMFDGTVGHGLFKDIVLTLDLHTNHVWIS